MHAVAAYPFLLTIVFCRFAFIPLYALYGVLSVLADQICAIGKRWSAGPSINEDWRFPDSNENVEAVIGGGGAGEIGAVNPERLQFPACFSISAFQHFSICG